MPHRSFLPPEGSPKVSWVQPLTGWQREVLDWTDDMQAPRSKTAVAAPNGSGKSERIIACAALRFISVAPRGRVVITSKHGRQVDNQIWPALLKRRAGSPTTPGTTER